MLKKLTATLDWGINMADFVFTPVIGKLNEFMTKIRSVGIPEKASIKWLKSLGFTSSNDNTILAVVKFINFCEPSGTPTDLWKKYRGAKHKEILAQAIKDAYSDLYKTYHQAHNEADENLKSFFTSHSTASEQVVTKTLRTFKALCAIADFNTTNNSSSQETTGTQENIQSTTTQPAMVVSSPTMHHASPSVHIDIQIHISSDATTNQIDQIFKSMAKHLYKNNNE